MRSSIAKVSSLDFFIIEIILLETKILSKFKLQQISLYSRIKLREFFL